MEYIKATKNYYKINLLNFTEEINKNDGVYYNNLFSRNKIPKGEGGIYLLLNRQGEIVYVGKSKNLRLRISTHINGQSQCVNKNEIESYKFCILNTAFERGIYESIYINLYKPKFNKDMKDF